MLPLWVSFPGLPFQFWFTEALSILGSKIGKPLFTDKVTMTREHLAYGICVKVEATKHLKELLALIIEGGQRCEQSVEYDWHHPQCDSCKCFGHNLCVKKPQPKQIWVEKRRPIT